MSDFNVLIPKLGESIQEATITKIFVKQGDTVVEDDLLFEIATDKVDSEIPSPVAGTIKEILCSENDLIPVGQVVSHAPRAPRRWPDLNCAPEDLPVRWPRGWTHRTERHLPHRRLRPLPGQGRGR